MSFTVKFKKLHPDAQLPKYARVDPTTGDAGADMYAVEDATIPAKGSALVETGIQVADMEPGYYFRIYPRSGLGFKFGLQPHLGTIDTQYRGTLAVKIYNFSDTDYTLKKGDRFAQIVFHKLYQPSFEWSDVVTETNRGASGFGASGK